MKVDPVYTNESPHDKTNKTGICPFWSESLQCGKWVAKDPSLLHADSEDSDQTGWIAQADLSLRWLHMPFRWFCHEVAQTIYDNLSPSNSLCLPIQTWPSSNHLFCLHINTSKILLYRRFPKYSDTQKICCNRSKIWTMWLYHRVMSPNNADGMANSVDPDETAQSTGSAPFAQTYLSENLG